MNPIASLLGAANVKNLITHPYVSPLFGDFHNFPPLLIQCGDAECLRDEGTLLAHKASLAGVQVYHEVYEDCPHVFQAMFFLEASKKAFRSHRNFVKRILPSGPRTKEGRRQRVDMSEMDQEVMSDAHAIKADGQPELASLPASPRAMRRELSSLTPVSADSATAMGGSDRHQALRNLTQAPGDQVDAGQETVEFLEEEGDLGYDDEEEDSNPFNVESSGASATTSDRDQSDTAEEGEFEQLPAPTGDDAIPEDGVSEGTCGDIAADLALSATAGMIKAGTAISGLNHHDLDSVAEEQDESINNIEAQEQHAASSRMSTSTSSSSYHFPRNTSSQRLHANHPHPHYPHQQPYQQYNSRRKQDSTSNSSTPAHSPSASFSSLTHSFSPSGSHTPLASAGGRTPVSSAPSSPGASMRNSQRQRSFSSLSMASLTPNNSLKRHGSSSSNRSALTEGTQSRPGHSRSNSSISIRTMRPGSFRENSKPRARANSHPDLQALLDSYDAAGPAQHTVMYMSEENEILGDDKDEGDVNNMDLDEPSAGSQDRSVSDDGSIDVHAFDT